MSLQRWTISLYQNVFTNVKGHWWDRNKPAGWSLSEQMCWPVWKQDTCTARLLTESKIHKIISKEKQDLFITTSVADVLPRPVLTDWPFAASAPSHRRHLHLSRPKCWAGEGESTQTAIFHKELQKELCELCLQRPVPCDESLQRGSLLYNSCYCCLLLFFLTHSFPL